MKIRKNKYPIVAALWAAIALLFTTTSINAVTYQIGGTNVLRDAGWNSGALSGDTLTVSFTNSTDTNLIFTVTAVAGSNDTLFAQATHIAVNSSARTGETGSSTNRINTNEVITLSVSYVDPNGMLASLAVDRVGAYWGNAAGEITVFSDNNGHATNIVAFDNGNYDTNLVNYASTGLDALTKANTAIWKMKVSVSDSNVVTTSGMGAFRLKYTLLTTRTLTYTAGPNGTISGTNPQTVFDGASGTAVTAVPNSGYYFVDWSDGSKANPRTDVNVTKDISVKATFAQVGTKVTTYQIGGLLEERNGAWSSPYSFADTIDPSLSFTVTAVAGNGDTLNVNNVYLAVDSSVRTGETNTTRLNDNEFITLSVSYSDPNGSLLALGVNRVGPAWGNAAGETTVFTDASAHSTNIVEFDHTVPNNLIPYATMGLDALTTNNTGTWTMKVSVANTNTTSGMGGFQLRYTVPAPTNTLIYTAGANGTISGTSTQTVLYGASGTAVTAVPNTGFYFLNWSDGSTNNPRTDTIVTSNISVTATFVQEGAVLGFYQIGGLAADRDAGWNSMSASGSTGTYSFTNATDTNLVFTVTAVAGAGSNYVLVAQSQHLAVDSSASGYDYDTNRLNDGEFITLSVSYVDPNGSLLALAVDKVGTMFGNGIGEITVFSDGSGNSTNLVSPASGALFDYASMGLDALTKNNTGSWTMKVLSPDTTTTGMGGFRLKYTVLTPTVVGDPPVIGSGVNVSGGNFNLSFTGTVGSHYVVQYTPVLPAPGPWQTVTDIVSLATSPMAISVPATNSTGFYRVGLVP